MPLNEHIQPQLGESSSRVQFTTHSASIPRKETNIARVQVSSGSSSSVMVLTHGNFKVACIKFNNLWDNSMHNSNFTVYTSLCSRL